MRKWFHSMSLKCDWHHLKLTIVDENVITSQKMSCPPRLIDIVPFAFTVLLHLYVGNILQWVHLEVGLLPFSVFLLPPLYIYLSLSMICSRKENGGSEIIGSILLRLQTSLLSMIRSALSKTWKNKLIEFNFDWWSHDASLLL